MPTTIDTPIDPRRELSENFVKAVSGLIAERRHQCIVSAAAISLSVSCVARSTSDTPVNPAAALASPSRRID